MNRIRLFSGLFIIFLLVISVLQCWGISSDLKIVHEQYQWTDDMKRLKITTPEMGLTFKITISNDGTEPLEINQVLYITVRVETKDRIWSFYRQLQISSLYLPPKEAQYHFVKVDFGGGSQIGSYNAKLTYSIGSSSLEGNPIEEYPFEFRILSPEKLQEEIQQSEGGGININIPVNISIEVIGIGSISVTILAILLFRKRRMKGK